MRDSAGIAPDFALHRHPALSRGAAPSYRTALLEAHSAAIGVAWLAIFERMKKLALLLLAAALVALLASLKFKRSGGAPDSPAGSWELADDTPS